MTTHGRGDIVVVGLNAALQKRFILSNDAKLVPGDVHRAVRVDTGCGGKGQDVAITLSCLQQVSGLSEDNRDVDVSGSDDGKIQLCQFVGQNDAAGKELHQLLVDRLGSNSVQDLTVRTKAPTRTCTSIVASDETTELVEPSGEISKSELAEMMKRIDDFYCGGGGGDSQTQRAARGLCIMGSVPPGIPNETYSNIFTKIVRSNPHSVCVVDAVVGTADLFDAAATFNNDSDPEDEQSPRIVFKINASELCKLTGVTKSKSETGGIQKDELEAAISTFTNTYPVAGSLAGLAITDGKHAAFLAEFQRSGSTYSLYELPIPQLNQDKTLYPIGAGDAVAGGMITAWATLVSAGSDNTKPLIPQPTNEILLKLYEKLQRNDLTTAFAFGLCCGSASCLQEENSVLSIADVDNLLQQYSEVKCIGKF